MLSATLRLHHASKSKNNPSFLVKMDPICTRVNPILNLVLIGSSDWEGYSLGRNGVERYRTQNLPANCSCPGLYELGIALDSGIGRMTRQRAFGKVMVLYLGEADNVRTRLQEYGRAGSHLNLGNSFTFANKNQSPFPQSGPSFFGDVFSRGHSIVYRWTPLGSKKDAETMEAKLLNVFDYAWNRRGNGACRHEDILLKLDKTSTSFTTISRMFQYLRQPLFSRKIGIKIHAGLPSDDMESTSNKSIIPKIFNFMKSQPQAVEQNSIICKGHEICGVAIGNGFVCKNRPVAGRKRCAEHKGKKIQGFTSVIKEEVLVSETNIKERSSEHKGKKIQGFTSVLKEEVLVPETNFCIASSYLSDVNEGRTRCDLLHEGRMLFKSEDQKLPADKSPSPIKTQVAANEIERHEICGVALGYGSICLKQPPRGRKRCELHKGMRVVNRATCSVKGTISKHDMDHEACGGALDDGSTCMNTPVLVRKRFELLRGQKVMGVDMLESSKGVSEEEKYKLEGINICGAITSDGYACRKQPARGRRCEEHKGQRILRSGVTKNIDISAEKERTSSSCGVTLANSEVCMSSPVPGRKRCSMHKGRRAN